MKRLPKSTIFVFSKGDKAEKLLTNGRNYVREQDEWIFEDNAIHHYVSPQDEWIFEASAIHLAAEYRPRNLQLILLSLKDTKHELIQKAHAQGNISPLHIASNNVDPLATKYVIYEII